MLGTVLLGACVRCFPDDLEQSLGGLLPSSVRIKRFAAIGDEFAELFCGLHDVGHAQFIATTQMGTASLRM